MLTFNNEHLLWDLIHKKLPTINREHCQADAVHGLTGKSWHIDAGKLSLLARQQTMENRLLGVDRQREARALTRCAQGIGPKVWLQHPDWLIVEWLVGDAVDEGVFQTICQNGVLAGLLSQLHHRPLSGYRLNLQKQFSVYWQHIDPRRLTPRWLHWQHYFMCHSPPQPLMLAPLHMDIHPGNLLIANEQLKLLDWEYVTDGDIALELAVFFRSNSLCYKAQQVFLYHYAQCGYPFSSKMAQHIQRWLPWVDYLRFMWFEVRWQQSADPDFLHSGAELYHYFAKQ